MRSDRTLDHVLVDLRQPPTVSELVGESEAVASISNALRSASAAPISAPRSARSLRVASFIAAGVIGFGSAAAAGPAVIDAVIGGDEPRLAAPADTTGPSDQSDEDATVGGDPAVEDPDGPAADQVADDPATAFDETSCADGNHGQTVNSIARATPSEPGKGQIVAEAAQSSCGKHQQSDDAPPADQVADDPATAFDETSCADGNHGETVNSVARATPSEPGKGQIVAEAAQSSCGKDHESGSDPVVAAGSGDDDGAKPDRKSDQKSDNKSDNQSDQKPDNQPDQKPDNQPDQKPDNQPDQKPDNQSDQKPTKKKSTDD